MDKLETAKAELRDEHRLKFGTDYCWTYKYNELRILCAVVFRGTIHECLTRHGIAATEWFNYN
jgi:hypothetical protein